MPALVPLVIALFAGAAVPLQAASNAALGRALGHPLWATLCSLLVSVAVLAPVLLAARVSAPTLAQATGGPPWLWLGGVAGVVYVTAALILAPRLGVANFIVCVIAGQMLASLVLDHFGLMGLPVRPTSAARLAGVLLILLGMAVVQWDNRAGAAPRAETSASVRK
ncbi:DMT family transporter [Pseudomonadota bacterium AL_CKDN230030165-1A_HGKHYDSX7]